MWVRLRFAGAYTLATNKKTDAINVPRGITLAELLDKLTLKYGPDFENRIREPDGRLRSNCRIFFGQQDVSNLGLQLNVKDGEDVILYFLMGMAGGGVPDSGTEVKDDAMGNGD